MEDRNLRILGIGDDASLGDMYIRLTAAGHEVKVFVADPDEQDTLNGLITRTADWRAELPWIRAAAWDGLILFEHAHMGETQDALRRDGFHVIGGSAFGDRLENDRAFGQAALRNIGLQTPRHRVFHDLRDAMDFVRKNPGRYVFKLNGSDFVSGQNYVGELDDGRDVTALLEHMEKYGRSSGPGEFILMDHKRGVEVGVGGYFNGEAFMDAVVIDWEHKRFFNTDLGELTGEMGTLLSYENAGPLFDATLGLMSVQLRASNYVGYINLNTIVNEEGIWPLEFTSRFGYPGFAICDALHAEGWDVLFRRMIARDRLDFPTLPGFAVGVVLTVPPFPRRDRYAELSRGLPILFREEMDEAAWRRIHLSEVACCEGQLVTSGQIGALMTVTGKGPSVEAGRAEAYRLAGNVVVPGLRYRTDIGSRFLSTDQAVMQKLGLWPS
jgi:phosphoribosylamine--glycine ligase